MEKVKLKYRLAEEEKAKKAKGKGKGKKKRKKGKKGKKALNKQVKQEVDSLLNISDESGAAGIVEQSTLFRVPRKPIRIIYQDEEPEQKQNTAETT